MSKKKTQLGMNPATAAHRLRTDILFKLVIGAGYVCCRCGEILTRESFSIDHLEPWLDSHDPVGLFFDTENIGFSHMSCNRAVARRPNQKYFTPEARTEAKLRRTRECKSRNSYYNPENRRAKYLRTGT